MVFCLFPTVVAVLSEIAIREIPNPYTFKFEWMKNNAHDVETLILGSSHTMYGIRPCCLNGKAFNLAFESQVPAYDFFLLDYFAQDYKKLKTVILPISFFTLFQRFEDMSTWWKCRYHHIYMDCHYHPYSIKYNYELGHYPSAFKKASTFIEKVYKGKDLRLVDETGYSLKCKFSERDTAQISDMNLVKLAIAWQTTNDWSHIDEIISSVNDIARFCRNRHIDLILITTPAWETYFKNLPDRQYSRMCQLVDSICTKNGLHYLNYLKDNRFVYDDFFDCDHLNDRGAVKFTKILNQDIQALKK